jgi:L-aspartate oxidase
MEGIDPRLELAPRDIVARAIWSEIQAGSRVYLDATGLRERIEDRFPSVLRLCLGNDLDPREEPMPVTPAAHYHMGGVVTGLDGRTSLRRLWACGETSWTGLHGANRLASNSLLEAVVYGRRVGRALVDVPRQNAPPEQVAARANRAGFTLGRQPRSDAGDPIVAELRKMMWRDVGLVRSTTGLRRAQLEIDRLERAVGRLSGEAANLLQVARLITTAAALRTETRGAHCRRDFPVSSSHWEQDLFFDGVRPLGPRPIDRLTSDENTDLHTELSDPWESQR